MPRLTNISGKEAVKAFVRLGFIHKRTSGDHAILVKENQHTLSIPLHKEVKPFLVKSQIKRAGIKLEDFLKFLK